MDWHLRSEIIALTHNWPITLLAFLLGSLIGLGLAYLLPPTYQAEAGLAVMYNGDAIYRNPDDYKNWYLEQLNVFVTSDDVLGETLARLRAQDAYWMKIELAALRPMVHQYWRSAGKWRLVAETNQAVHADQLAQTWRQVVLEKSHSAIQAATRMLELDHQYQATARAQAEVHLRSVELAAIKAAIQSTSASLAQNPSPQPLSTLDRWHLLTLAARVSQMNATELQLVTGAPPPESPAQAYLPWLDQVLIALDNQLTASQAQEEQLAQQSNQISEDWTAASKASAGLSAYMTVEPLSADIQPAQPIRSPGTLALIGGILGLFAWGLIWLGQPFRQGRR